MKAKSVRKKPPPGERPATSAIGPGIPSGFQPGSSVLVKPDPPWRRRLPVALLWSAVVIAVAFCGCRFAAFRLLPLDSPGTLHATLWPLFKRLLVSYPTLEEFAPAWVSRGLVTLLLPFVLVFLCFVPLRPPLRRVLLSRTLFWVSVAACLLYWRFPVVLGGASNVDEAEFTVSATKLLSDPVFFRSTNVGTSGPLNIFPLTLPALFGFSPDYASGRAIALLIIFLTLFFLHRAFTEMASDELGRAAILPALGFFSLASFPDFVHYSAELVPMLLTALAVLACVRAFHNPANSTRPLLALGFLVSAAFFSKMQAVPILAAAAVFAAIALYLSRKVRPWWKPVFLLAVGFAPLPLLNLLVAAAAGVAREASVGYISGNAHFSRSTRSFFADVPGLPGAIASTPEMQFLLLILLSLAAATAYAVLRGDRERELLRFAGGGAVAAATFAGLLRFKTLVESHTLQTGAALIILAAAGIVAFVFLQRARVFGIFSLALLAAAIFAVYLSPQKFPHYMELLVVPISTLIAWLLIRQGRRLSTVFFALALTIAGESALWKHAHVNLWAAHEVMAFPGGDVISTLTHPGAAIVVWGWRPELYLSAGRVPAARESNVFTNQDSDPQGAGRILRVLNRTRPELIVDAVDVSCCNIDNRARYGFEVVPSLNSYIHANYTLVAEKYREKFYLRRDVLRPAESLP